MWTVFFVRLPVPLMDSILDRQTARASCWKGNGACDLVEAHTAGNLERGPRQVLGSLGGM